MPGRWPPGPASCPRSRKPPRPGRRRRGEETAPLDSGEGQTVGLPENLEWTVILCMCGSDLETNAGSMSYTLAYLEGIYDEMDLMDSYGALLKVMGADADADREVIAFGGEMTGGKKVFYDNPVLFSTGGGMGFSLGRAPLIGGSTGYYSSYFKVTDLAGNSFLSDPYAYIIADSYRDFYLGVVPPVLRDPETGNIPKLSDGAIRIMYNGIDVTDSVCPDLDPADVVVTYNKEKTMGTVEVDIDLGGDFEHGTLVTYFAVCPDTESFMAACAELLYGQYARDPEEYGQNKHSFGDCEDPYELLEHIRVVENVKYYYELGLDMGSEADLKALNDAYALLTKNLDARLTSEDMELLDPFSAYGYAEGLTFTAEKMAPAGNAAYQNVTAGMGKVRSYRVGLSKPAAVKLTLSGLSKSDIDNLRVYYMENGSAAPQLIPRENSGSSGKDHITLVENRGEPYLVISTFQALNDSYFVLCAPANTPSSSGGTGSGSTTTPGTTVKTTTATATTTGTTASATVSSTTLNSTISSAVTEAAQKGTAPVVEVKVNTAAAADSLEVTLPAASLETLAGTEVVDLSMVSDGVAIHEYNGGSITVSLPYTLKSGETAGDIVVYFLDDDGSLTRCATSYAGGKVTFTTSHLSKYVIGTRAMAPEPSAAFVDVPAGEYYADAVAWAVANGVTKGTDDTHFSPNNGCTRAQFVTFMYRCAQKAGIATATGVASFDGVSNEGALAAYYGPSRTASPTATAPSARWTTATAR